MPTSDEHAYPPREWTADGLAEAIETARGAFPIPIYEDTDTWDALRSDPLTKPLATSLVEYAEQAQDDPIPSLPASRYLEYTRTGNRTRYQDAERDRRKRLTAFVLAECLERDGDYLDDVLDYSWAICEQSTWTWPAHLRDEQRLDGLPRVVDDEDRTVGLFSVGTALLLAEVAYVLGDRLHPALRERIRTEIDRRILTPYESRDDFSWMAPPTSNWNAVCNAGVAIAALHVLDDADRRARIIAKATRNLRHYLADFDEDGCTAEGIGYWNYGFGNYVALAADLEAVTGGEYSLLSPPIVDRIADYPLKTELSPGHFVPFSDADENGHVAPRAAAWLGNRLDKPGLAARGRWELAHRSDPFESHNVVNLPELLRDLFWTRTVPEDRALPTPPRRHYFGGFDWWISRVDPTDPDALVVAAKGGHNAEAHNHNDCGSVVVHFRGESLLTDPGRPTYDRDYFSDRRYEYFTARSLGHSVPFVNGYEQAAGEEYEATVLDRAASPRTDSFTVDLSGSYPDDAGLDSLRRTVTLDRDRSAVRLEDEATFAEDAPGSAFESVLISYFPIEATDDALVVTGDRGRAVVTPDEHARFEVEHLENEVDMSERADGYRDVWRARIAPASGAATVSSTAGSETVSLDLRIDLLDDT